MEEKIPDSIKKKQSEEVAKENCHNPNSPLKGNIGGAEKSAQKKRFFILECFRSIANSLKVLEDLFEGRNLSPLPHE